MSQGGTLSAAHLSHTATASLASPSYNSRLDAVFTQDLRIDSSFWWPEFRHPSASSSRPTRWHAVCLLNQWSTDAPNRKVSTMKRRLTLNRSTLRNLNRPE